MKKTHTIQKQNKPQGVVEALMDFIGPPTYFQGEHELHSMDRATGAQEGQYLLRMTQDRNSGLPHSRALPCLPVIVTHERACDF